MDLSKLPRLSKTETGQAPGAPGAPGLTDSAGAGAGAGAASDVTAAPAATYCNRCGAPLRPGARFCDSCGAATDASPRVRVDYAPVGAPADAGFGAEIWLSAIIGAVLMLMGRSFGGYLIARLTGQTYHTNTNWVAGPKEGQEVGYWELDGFTALSDSAIFLFGLTMVLEALVLALVSTRFKAKAPLVTVALLFTVLVTAYNAVVAAKLMASNMLPITSLLAVAFGGYIAVFEWRLLRQLRPAPRVNV